MLLHLSDIHFRESKDPVASRALRVKEAILSKCPNPEACIIAVSGDIANTGHPAEYEVAKSFFTELRSAILLAGIPQVEFVFVPGNHDCNLRRQNETRKYLLESLDTYLSKPIDFDGSNFSSLIDVQQDFFAFEATTCGHDVLAAAEKLYYKRLFALDGKTVVFHCFNTAWLSRLHEVPAELHFPPELLTGPVDGTAVVSIALFHHPFNWLNTENYRTLKKYVERQADIILIGHEHVGEGARKQTFSGEQMDYFEAPAFHDWDNLTSGFALCILDTSEERQLISTFEWTASRYAESKTLNWQLVRNPARPNDKFEIARPFLTELRSLGTGLRHPRCSPPRCELSLRDLYVYPDLRERDIEGAVTGKRKSTSTVAGEESKEYVIAKERIIIYGADDSGKSSLAKILYQDFHDRGLLPLLIRGEDLRGRTKEGSLSALLQANAAAQYGSDKCESYLQQDSSKRLLIVDDFHLAKLTKAAQQNVMDRLCVRFQYIIVLASDLFRLQELARSVEIGAFNGLSRCEIKEFGKFHRHRLIEKWQYFGREDSTEPEELARLVLWTDKTIATLLGKNVLPHYPVTILQLLQLLEVRETTTTTNGSYGYLYEVLIKSALAGSETGMKDVDLKVTYMSGLAYSLFRSKTLALTEAELRAAHNEYCQRYDIIRDFGQMIGELRSAEMLVESGGYYRFKYPYIFYYSVAKYLQENSDNLRTQLNGIADHIYNDTNANVLIFYVYLTKDAALIRRLIDNAKAIYDEHSPCDMEKDVEFINRMLTQPSQPLQLSTDIRSNRDEYNKKQDAAAEAQQESEENSAESPDYAYDKQLQDVVKLNIAFKTLQILGQVLRNFPGSLDGTLKLDITSECYLLGLRTIHALLRLASNNLESFRSYIADIIAERTGLADQELAAKTDMAIGWLTEAATFGSIKRVSYAVGHQDLTATYERVFKTHDGLATRIIDAAIKLDHYDDVPQRELEQLRSMVRKNPFAASVIRDLVADYMYLYGCDFPVMQQLSADWNIKIVAPKYLLSRAKKA